MTTKKLIFEKGREKIGNLNIKIGRLSAWIVIAFVLGCVSCRRASARDQSSYLHQPVVAVSYFCEPAVATQKIDSYSSNTVKNVFFNNNLQTHYNHENNLISHLDLVYSLNQLQIKTEDGLNTYFYKDQFKSKNYEKKLNNVKSLKRENKIITTCCKPIFPRITSLKLKTPEKLRSNITGTLIDKQFVSFFIIK